ncbi:UNVERIFIED_CONTAM: hypothetical protein NCL1_13946 [Trichonephila clavipes]
MPRRRIRAHYEQMSEFERCRIIGLKKAGRANRRITRHMGRSDPAIRKRWQESVDSSCSILRFPTHSHRKLSEK